MVHFSRYIRPNARVIGITKTDDTLMVTAVKNPDQSIAVVLFNEGIEAKIFALNIEGHSINIKISKQAIQTILIPTI
jgi:glucosylceramidase